MNIDIRQPQIKILLHKNVGRSTLNGSVPVSMRFAGQAQTVDLTPYLGEAGSIRLTKSVREPAGSFSIALSDQIDQDVQDSLYGIIEPMDSIEISVSGSGISYGAGGPPIMMRGFVSQPQRQEGMGADGKPTRRVVISGQDYGKILQIMQIFFMPNSPDDAANLITSFPFFSKFGAQANVMDAGAFTQSMFDKVINPYIAKMQQSADGRINSSPILPISTDIQIKNCQVSPFSTGGWRGGTITSLINSYGDIGAWNEFFIEDRADAPYAVYRPNPFRDAVSQAYILPGVTPPAVTAIDRTDVISITSSRSDANIGNYFWVESPRFLLNYDFTAKAMAYQSSQVLGSSPIYNKTYGNINPDLYGTRKMEERTNQLGAGETDQGNGTAMGAPRIKNYTNAIEWMNNRRQQLFEQNKDNVVFESGSMRLKGNENIKAGTYIRLTHGSMQSFYYVVSVMHDFQPFGSYFTEVQFERGTGFIDRVQRAGDQDSPYWDELVTRQ